MFDETRKHARSNLARMWPDEFQAHQLTCSDAPDTSGVNAAAIDQVQLGREALHWYQQVYADTAGERAEAAEAGREQAALQREMSLDFLTQQREQRGRFNEVFAPVEDAIAQDALAYDTPERREQAAGQAMADVTSQVGLARADALREAEARGVDPSSGNFATALSRGAVQEGAMRAAAGNNARERIEAVGHAKKMDAAGVGRGVISNQATQAQMGLASGNSSVLNANVPNTVAQQGADFAGRGYQSAMAGNESGGAMFGKAAGMGATNNAGLWQAVGSVAGALIASSDKKQKKAVRPVKGEVALAAARRMPVKSWKYKKGSPADDGGKRHVGPMAQDVQAALGDEAAPGGKAVDLISLAGAALAAVQAVDKKVQRLERASRSRH